jgi:uncharacterized protein YbjT (DUF2867 family)
VLDVIIKSGKFNVTVLVRSSSSATFPSSVKVIQVDFSSLASLTTALQGQDALVSTVGTSGLQGQTLMVDACIAAGVSRFLPSEFGTDIANPQTKALPVFGYKVAVVQHTEEKARINPGFSYTFVRTGAFLGWGLERNFLLDLKSGTPCIYASGDQLFSTTTLASIGRAVVGVLSHPEETKNRAVYVQDIAISQNRLLAIARKLAPSIKLDPVYASTVEMKKAADERIAKGEFTMDVLVQHIIVSIFGEGYGGHMAKTDNELLGMPGDMTNQDVEAILKPLLARVK